MLSFTSLLVVCLVVSAVVYFLYKIVSDSSRSVYKSKEPLALVGSEQKRNKSRNRDYPIGKSAAFGQAGEHSSPRNFAQTYPAMPGNDVDWKYQGSGVMLREPELKPGNAQGKSAHCSLYDASSQQAATKPNPYTGRLHRIEAEGSAGKTYKVTRKPGRSDGEDDDGDLHRPWGW